jgi:polar amino acid transport system substrate-binding protein
MPQNMPGECVSAKAIAAIWFVIIVVVPAWADSSTLRVAVGLRLAPYVLDNEVGGLEYEYVDMIMTQMGYQITPVYVPLRDVPAAIDTGKADMALTMTDNAALSLPLSDPYVAYHNAAITLVQRKLALTRLDDLKNYSVAAFDHATTYLGPTFSQLMAGKKDYREYSNQMAQNILLYQGKVDVVVADINIYAHLDDVIRHVATSTVLPTQHALLFPPSCYRVMFRDGALRDRFNAALHHAHSLPGYKLIGERWQEQVGEPVGDILLEGAVPK